MSAPPFSTRLTTVDTFGPGGTLVRLNLFTHPGGEIVAGNTRLPDGEIAGSGAHVIDVAAAALVQGF